MNNKLTNAEAMFVEMKAIIDDHDATIGIHKVVTDSHAKEHKKLSPQKKAPAKLSERS